jgi:predicted lipoprotein with Yx(FWY)xxD motif
MRADSSRRRAALLAALAAPLLAAACSSSAASTQPSLLSGSMGSSIAAYLKPEKTPASGTVVADGDGYTLYWFSQDTATYSACDDVCVPQWPPVTGAPKVEPGATLAGRLGVLIRSDGVIQATYEGHPLYTFAGDFDPGDVGGNGVVQFGGTWHVVRPG